MEAVTWSCAVDYLEGEDHTIQKPEQYDFWRTYRPNLKPPWPDYPLFSLWVSHPKSDRPEQLSFVPTMGKFAGYKQTLDKRAESPDKRAESLDKCAESPDKCAGSLDKCAGSLSLDKRAESLDKRAGSKVGEINLWLYRRIIDHANFEAGTFPSDITMINWPQNDYMLGNLFGGTEEENAQSTVKVPDN